jgi:hypothetical protein
MIDFHIDNSRKLEVEPIVTVALMEAVDNAVDKPELIAFYDIFIKPYWCLSAYYRFIATHGTNVTQFGVSVARDPKGTFNEATGDQRALILRQVHSDRTVYKNYMVEKLKQVNFTFDGVSFAESEVIDRSQTYVTTVKKTDIRINKYI